MTAGISAIESYSIAASYFISTSTNLLKTVTDLTRRKLETHGITVSETTTEQEAQAVLEEKEAEKTQKTQSVQNSETYYDKQIMADALSLAQDLGIYVGGNIDIYTLMENIKDQLTMLEGVIGDNKNMKAILDEYQSRYAYVYSQYMDKKGTLANQMVSTLDIMGSTNIASSGLSY